MRAEPRPTCAWPNTGDVPSPEHCYSGPRCAHTWGGLVAVSPEDQTVTYSLPVCVAHEHVAADAGWTVGPPGVTAE